MSGGKYDNKKSGRHGKTKTWGKGRIDWQWEIKEMTIEMHLN